MKASAIAHSNIAFVKYWGKKDPKTFIPTRSNISMTLDALTSTTTIEFSNDFDKDSIIINGKEQVGKPFEKAVKHINTIRNFANTNEKVKIISENNDSEYPQKIFELGRVFYTDKNKNIVEKERLSIAVTPGNFTDLKQVLDYLFYNIGLEFKVKEPEKDSLPFVEGRVAEIIFEGEKIGLMGEVHPKILKNWKIKMPVSALEIDLKKILATFK